ncbi:MAG: MoaD/ThiS family protein [Ferruginibacter sp.]|nr:MoaD/ThiS family protein [Ferruginibacter sp.]
MEITIRSFGSIADITGKTFLLKDVTDIETLKQKLYDAYPELIHKSFIISVDKKIATNETILPNAAVALLPPFSGG